MILSSHWRYIERTQVTDTTFTLLQDTELNMINMILKLLLQG